MSSPTLNLDTASDLIERAQAVIDGALRQLATRGGDRPATDARLRPRPRLERDRDRAGVPLLRRQGRDGSLARAAFLALALSDLATRVLGRESLWGVSAQWYEPFASFVATYRDPTFLATLAETPGSAPPRRGLPDGRRHVPPFRRGAGSSPRRARAPHQRGHPRVHHRGSERTRGLRALGARGVRRIRRPAASRSTSAWSSPPRSSPGAASASAARSSRVPRSSRARSCTAERREQKEQVATAPRVGRDARRRRGHRARLRQRRRGAQHDGDEDGGRLAPQRRPRPGARSPRAPTC